MAKPGRNDLCACGSGRKFKKCCASKTASARQGRVWMIVVGLAVVGALAAGVASFRGDASGRVRVWDPGHGHYHDANGVAVP
jgi:SEC-C motif-containing protein